MNKLLSILAIATLLSGCDSLTRGNAKDVIQSFLQNTPRVLDNSEQLYQADFVGFVPLAAYIPQCRMSDGCKSDASFLSYDEIIKLIISEPFDEIQINRIGSRTEGIRHLAKTLHWLWRMGLIKRFESDAKRERLFAYVKDEYVNNCRPQELYVDGYGCRLIVAQRNVSAISGLLELNNSSFEVELEVRLDPTPMGKLFCNYQTTYENHRAILVRYDDGWRVKQTTIGNKNSTIRSDVQNLHRAERGW